MLRAIPLLVSAILVARPAMPQEQASRYAGVLQKVAAEYQFDPLTAVAIIQHESHWASGVVSPDGEDFGLGQVRARYVGACRDDADPVNAPSDACREVKARLLSPIENMQAMGKIIRANREFCGKLGLTRTEHWLAGYQGYGAPSRKEFCKPGPMTKDVLDYQAELLAKVSPKKKVDPRKADAKSPAKKGGAPAAKHAPEVKKPAPPAPAAKAAPHPKVAAKPAPPHPRVAAKPAAPKGPSHNKSPLAKTKPAAAPKKQAAKKH